MHLATTNKCKRGCDVNYRIAAGVVLPEKIEIEPVGGRKCVVLRIIQQNFGPVVQWFYMRVHQYVGP